MNKILIKILIVIWSIIAVTFTALLVYGIVYNKRSGDIFSFFKYRVESTLAVQKDENIDLNGVNKINLDFSSSEIIVQTTDESSMRVVQKSAGNLNDDEKFTIIKQDNEVTIKRNNLQKCFTIFNFGSHEEKIEVYIPKNYNKDLDINSSSGDIEFNSDMNLENIKCIARSGNLVVKNNINAKDITLKASSGDIRVDALTSNTYKINTSSGDIDVDSLTGSGELQSSSGNVQVNYKDIIEYSNVNAHSGDVKLVIPAELSFEFNGKCTSGDIQSNFNLNYKNERKNEATAQIGSGPYKKITASTNSGDIRISN